jgi:hypothetical protein
VPNSSYCEEAADGGYFGNWGEGVFVIDTFALCKPLCNKPGFVTLDAAISFVLDLKNPLATDGSLARG